MAPVERFPVHHHSADYISFPLAHWAHCGIFENGVLLMYSPEGVSGVANFKLLMESLNKTETAFFSNPQCVLFFQGQSF